MEKCLKKWTLLILIVLPMAFMVVGCDLLLDAEPETYLVLYSSNGATGGSTPTQQTKTHDEALTIAGNTGSLVKTGYAFDGWNTAANGSGTTYAPGSTYTGNAPLSLYAQWVADTYAVTYNANEATSGTAPSDQEKTHDTTLTLATNTGSLEKTGYTFSGWNTAANGSGTTYAEGASYTTNADVTLYAQWTANSYTVSFDSQGATTDADPTSKTVTIPATSIDGLPAAPEKSGHMFVGWFTAVDGGGSEFTASTEVTGDITVYADWIVPEVGDIGPSGGYVFYDDVIGYDLDDNGTIEESEKNLLGDGLRFLEAAPADVVIGGSDYTHIFGYYRTAPDGASTLVGVTATDVGTGKTNTDALVAAMEDAAYTSSTISTTTTTGDYAARLCTLHEAGGYNDWFLPSKDELNQMHLNLRGQGLGDFSTSYYWSSSEDSADEAWQQYFGASGSQYVNPRNNAVRVRPVRAF